MTVLIKKPCLSPVFFDMMAVNLNGPTPSRRQNFGIVCLLVAVAIGSFTIGPQARYVHAEEPAAKSVRLVIDYGDGVEKHFTRIAWKPGMTVLDALEQAAQAKHGIEIKYRGRGETAFLMKIDDLRNESGGRDSRNWFYSVNGKLAMKSFGIYEPDRGDEILWKFGPYESKP